MDREVEASTIVRAERTTVEELLRVEPGFVLSDPERRDRADRRTMYTSLEATVGGGTAVAQDVAIEFGPVRRSPKGCVVTVTWTPEGHERVLPSFEGSLSASSTEDHRTLIEMSGHYAVPFGPVGRVGDAVLGRRVARSTVSTLVEELGRRIDAQTDRSRQSTSWNPAPYNKDLRPDTRSAHRID